MSKPIVAIVMGLGSGLPAAESSLEVLRSVGAAPR